jgi:hypothetical protein
MSVPYGIMRETYEVEDLKLCAIPGRVAGFSGLTVHGFGPTDSFYDIFGIALKLIKRLFFLSYIINHNDRRLGVHSGL